MSDDDDFNPATMDDDTIYIGTRKYVAADHIKELEAKLSKSEAMRQHLQSLVIWGRGIG
jgi:hypothetical protein